MMTPAAIRAQFDRWIEFPKGSDRLFVTTTSTLMFAEHIAEMAVRLEREARHRVADASKTITTPNCTGCDCADNEPCQKTDGSAA